MEKLHTTRTIADLIRLAEGPNLATVTDEDMLRECASDLFDILQLCDDEVDEGTRRHVMDPARLEAALCEFVERYEYVALKAATYATEAEVEDEMLMGLLTRLASGNPTKH